jgi:hypothetical protein
MSIGTVVGDAASSATGVGDVVKIISGMVTLLASPTGQALLNQIFVDHGLTIDKLNAALDQLKSPPDPR